MRIIYECISGDAGLFVVALAESTVNDNEFAVGPDGELPVFFLYRCVAIDDVTVVSIQTKLSEKHIANPLIIKP